MTRSKVIDSLRRQLEAEEPAPARRSVETFALPLRAGGVHEWLGGEGGTKWMPPLCILTDLAQRTVEREGEHDKSGVAVWIGRRCFPQARILVAPCGEGGEVGVVGNGLGLLADSIFVDPPDIEARLWAIDTALRSPAVAVVIADGRALDMAASRRLQLAAESSGALALVARPLTELKTLSAATSRWVVRPAPSLTSMKPRWNVELIRNKGPRAVRADKGTSEWCVEWDDDACALVVPAAMERGTGASESAPAAAVRRIG